MSSTRQLAKQLGVSRNTTIAAVQELIADGYLISRERSGCYVNEEILKQKIKPEIQRERKESSGFWRKKLKHNVGCSDSHPANWQQYLYPFIEGQFDPSLFPVPEWRECARIIGDIREINSWATDSGDSDDSLLIEQVRSRLLLQRGIGADADEILITTGSQNGLALIAQLLLSKETRVGVEFPGYADATSLFQLYQPEIVHIPVDDEGLVIGELSESCDIIYTTPSHQFPTTVTMSMDRRRCLLEQAHLQGSVIIEDDFTRESNFMTVDSPALKSMDKDDLVIYVSSLSKTLAPGIRVGYMVASREFISQARALRRLTSRHPANNNQRAVALFLSLGHFDSLSRRLHQVHKQRWLELRQAVNYCFP